MPSPKLAFISVLFASVFMPSAVLSWELESDQSVVSFVSIKKGNIGESHTFKEVSGTIKDGAITVVIKPDSVDSKVPIRDERMREFLFDTVNFPTIEVTADVSSTLSALNEGEPTLVQLPATVSMHGIESIETLDLFVIKSGNTLSAVSSKPVLVRAKNYGMVEGITKLASLVNNLAIAESIPVSFSLVFNKPAVTLNQEAKLN